MMTPTPPRAGSYRYIALAFITIVLALSVGDRATLSVAGPEMSKALGISPIGMGWLFSSFAWAYALGQIPGGWIVDRLGVKRSLMWGLILWSLVTFGMGFAPWFAAPFVMLMIMRFVLGICESPVTPGSARVLAAWFPSGERGMAGSIFNSAQYIALVLFSPLMGWLSHRFGWESVFTVMGSIGLLLAFVWNLGFFVPARHPRPNPAEISYIAAGGALIDVDADTGRTAATGGAEKTAHVPVLQALAALFGSRMLVGIFIAQYGINAITWFFVSWFPTYLVKGLGFTILQAGFLAALPAVCGVVGAVISGFFSDYLLKKTGSLSIARKVPITIGLFMSALMIGCNYTRSETLVIFLMSAAFFGKGFGSLGWTVVADTAPKQVIGLTGGVFSAIGNSAGIVTPLVIGYILAGTNSFEYALLFVGLHGIMAVLSYWLIVGKIERFELPGLVGACAAPAMACPDPGHAAAGPAPRPSPEKTTA
ncbi:MAG: MFS transporter [Rhodoplanes sp.]|uniref:MFS transporter n=1 Tax=Rhodoplanes sp. TaxID=1968906 RepID=UPI0017E636F9|nr:MFS transporter [Rhodoplanes sp.]NVO15140.1 MFS transporter [Rhodoplanes sp.]